MDEEERTDGPYDDSLPGQEEDNDDGLADDSIRQDEESAAEEAEVVAHRRGRRAAQSEALLRERYGEPEGSTEEQQGQRPPVAAAQTQAAQVAAAPEKRFTPQYRPADLGADERAAHKQRIAAKLAEFDYDGAAEEMMSAADAIASRRNDAAMENYLSAQVHTANDQIEAMAQANLYRAARDNPAILANKTAAAAARYGAAIQYAIESGDPNAMHDAISKVLESSRPRANQAQQAPRQEDTAPPRRDSAPVNSQAVPTGNGGGVGGGGAARRNTSSVRRMHEDALPFADGAVLDEILGRR